MQIIFAIFLLMKNKKIKISFWEKFLLIFIAFTIAISIYFIWPPYQIEDQEQYFGYLDEEFDGLPKLIFFKPRLNADNKNIEIVIPETDLNMEAKLIISKLNIEAPIIFNVNAGSNVKYLSALESGVAHFAGTAMPNIDTGNTFIFGHSSYYYNQPGDYKEIFADLGKISQNDEIIIKRTDQEEEYKYAVDEIKIVEASYTEAFSQEGEKRLTLMTCWPVGTSRERLLVIAKPAK